MATLLLSGPGANAAESCDRTCLEGFVHQPGKLPLARNARYTENGVITSNDPASNSEITRMSRGAQFATGFTKVSTPVQVPCGRYAGWPATGKR
jgi:hypothetical protein